MVEKEYYYDTWQDYVNEYDEDQHFPLLDAVREDKTVMYASIEYGEESLAELCVDIANDYGFKYEWEC